MLGLGVVIVSATVVTSLAAFSNPGADEELHRLLAGWTWLDALAWVDDLGMWMVATMIGVVVALGWRCRALLLAGLGTTAVAYLLGTGLAVMVGRDRPVGSLVAGTDSYPSVPLLVLVTIGGLVATAAHTSGLPWWVLRVVTGVPAVMIGAAALVEVHGGLRRPFDVLGSVLIGGGLVLALRILLARPAWHRACRGCSWGQLRSARRGEEPAVEVDSGQAVLLHRATLGWVTVLVVAYAVVSLRRGLPRSPESGVMGSGIEVPLQWGLLGLMVVGVLVARRWHATGAVLVAAAAGLLGYASSVQYPPLIGLLIAAVAWAPALMLWLEWHRRASTRSALVVAVVTSLALGVVVGAGALTYASLAGPTHSRSPSPAPDTDVVEWMWAGGVTSDGMEVRMRTADEAGRVRLLVALAEDLAAPLVTPEAEVDSDRVVAVRVTGLMPDTRYYYAVEVDGELERGRVQTVKTFPVGAASFDFVVGSCQMGGSNGLVFDAMRATTPLFALATGDWNYSNIEANDPQRFEEQYDLNLTSPAQAALYATTPIAYVWGDHDYGGNDADRTSPSRPAAMSSYRHLTPHYELADRAEAPIYQAFTVGRVRFLLTDTRSARDPVGDHADGFRSTLERNSASGCSGRSPTPVGTASSSG